MKKTRNLKTFEPEPDVATMLERAQGCGLTLGEILNQAMREHGRDLIRALIERKLRELKKVSFERADLRSDSLQELAA